MLNHNDILIESFFEHAGDYVTLEAFLLAMPEHLALGWDTLKSLWNQQLNRNIMD